MAKIVTITNPLTGQPAQVDQLDHTAQQIDDGLNIARNVSNPNLLDNWYFANPVNQRGQTSYTGSGYGIDRWGLFNTTYNVDTGELISNGDFGQLNQKTDMYESLAGKTVTVSILFDSLDDGWRLRLQDDGMMVNIPTDSNLFTHTYIYPHEAQTRENAFCLMNFTAGAKCKPIAVKLELGSQQTLAHQDSNGKWVLNELPNYADQLMRCQRYQVLYSNLKKDEFAAPIGAGYSYNGNTIFVMFDLPQELCKSATKEVEIIGSLANFGLYYSQEEYVVPTAVSIDQVGTRYIGLKFTVPSTPASSYVLKPRTTGTGLLIKANL